MARLHIFEMEKKWNRDHIKRSEIELMASLRLSFTIFNYYAWVYTIQQPVLSLELFYLVN